MTSAIGGLAPPGVADSVGNSVGAVEAIAADLSSDTATAVIQAAEKRCCPPSGWNK